MSVPAETELAAMLVPSWARANASAMKKTPARFLLVPSFRNDCRRSRGFQIASPKMTFEDEDTIIPMKEVIANPMGIVRSWDHRASFGLRAKRAKSGSFYVTSDWYQHERADVTYHNECRKVGNR